MPLLTESLSDITGHMLNSCAEHTLPKVAPTSPEASHILAQEPASSLHAISDKDTAAFDFMVRKRRHTAVESVLHIYCMLAFLIEILLRPSV